MNGVQAVVFDAYGTLLDVRRGTVEACAALFPDRAEELARLWRSKQLEYTWLRSLMGAYRDFWAVTREALEHAAAALEIRLDAAATERLAGSYLTLPPFAEAAEVLAGLAGRVRAVLSNGAPDMLARVLRHAGLDGLLDAVLSADEVGVYKPHPRVYGLVPHRLGVPPDRVLFVSGNYWDCAGARASGLQAVWVNRTGAPADALGAAPDAEVRDLRGVRELLEPGSWPGPGCA